MAQTLYDLLEVSPKASLEAIQISYERLKNKYLDGQLKSPSLDPDTHFNLIKDAYQTLSKAELRERYDNKLNPPPATREPAFVYAEQEFSPLIKHGWKWALLAFAIFGAVLYFRAAHQLKAEQLRIQAEQIRLEKEAREQAQASQDAYNEQQQLREQERRERQEKYDAQRQRDSLSRESDRINSDLANASRQAQREDERAKKQAEYQQSRTENARQRDSYEAQRRIDRERELARELERDNRANTPRAGSIERTQP